MEIEDLRNSISELSRREMELRDRVKGEDLVPRVERRKVIIEELLLDIDEEPVAKAFDEYFTEEDPFVDKCREALFQQD